MTCAQCRHIRPPMPGTETEWCAKYAITRPANAKPAAGCKETSE